MLADGLLMERRRTYKIIFMLQVIGTARSKDTQKAIRYLKERSLPFQFVDLGSRTLSEKEWKRGAGTLRVTSAELLPRPSA